MSEAEDEAVKKHPQIAQAIRAERLRYEKDANYCPRLEQLLALVKKNFPQGMSGFDVKEGMKLSQWLMIGGLATLLVLHLKD
ncbi:MAG: hypothetical protein F6K48_03165 [Okeania sp. SIO3H1]|nr:hypothetical protein [Okeania sp. SIO3H1]